MSLRMIKYLLGANNLERKIRLLFGFSLLLLITGSFWWYGSETEKELYRTKRRTGVHLVDAIMLKYHWKEWAIVEFKPLVVDMIEGLENLKYDYKFLALEAVPDRLDIGTPATMDPKELRMVTELRDEFFQQLEDAASRAFNQSADELETSVPDADVDTEFTETIAKHDIKNRDRWDYKSKEYQYYQPVYWRRSCHRCHDQDGADMNYASTEGTSGLADDLPFRVIKVVIPDEQYESVINRHRAIFMATAIITVFLAMIALYVVVRFVIVKPLQHLREVSDEVGRGNYSLRAEIDTDDEFEELANSYNRMLRHLVESQEQLRDANTNLDGKLDQLAQMNMQLYEMNRLKGDFLANVSHELRTPLNSIIGFSDVLQGIDALNDKQKKYVTNIGKSGHVLLDMINDILDLAKMESGKSRVRPTEFALDMLVKSQSEVVRSLAEDKNIALDVECESDFTSVFQDQAKLQQILTNLLSNAIKFTPDGGRINVRVRREMGHEPVGGDGNSAFLDNDAGWIVVAVEDTGVGIADEDTEVIFEKFRQANVTRTGDNLTREFSGTGLGLSIVKELCRLLGGEIQVTSQLGQGSVFTINLPWILPASLATSAGGNSIDESSLRFRDVRSQESDGGQTPPAEATSSVDLSGDPSTPHSSQSSTTS